MKIKISHFFRDLSFRRKINLLCLLVSLIPFSLMGIVSYSTIRTQITDRERLALAETLRQQTDQIRSKLDVYMNVLNQIAWNENIKASLAQEYKTNYDLYMFYKGSIDSSFLAIRTLNTDITAVTIYSDGSINPHGDYVSKLSSAEAMPWYERSLTSTAPFYSVSEDRQTLYLVCKMFYLYDAPTSVVCVSVDMDALMQSAKSLFQDNYGFLVTDASGKLVYDSTVFSQESPFTDFPREDILAEKQPDNYVVECALIDSSEWTVYLYRPLSELYSAVRQLTITAFIISVLCFLISSTAASFLSKSMVSPLERLSRNMESVEQGIYDITVEENRTDEIGKLIHSFRAMVQELDHLVHEVLEAKISQQKAELKILQAQINPHFLYNSLSLINGKAIMMGQTDISQMAQLLSRFYRTSLNKGRSITTVANEIENMKAYVSLQQIMHSYSFDVYYDIDETLLSYPVLNLILQPLTENAILHGLDHREAAGKGILSISCYVEGDNILFKIMDNGQGMTKKECEEILTADSKGYGVKNVHQRIQLFYGDAYGVNYHSTFGYGTYAIIRVARKLEEL